MLKVLHETTDSSKYSFYLAILFKIKVLKSVLEPFWVSQRIFPVTVFKKTIVFLSVKNILNNLKSLFPL